MRIWLGLLPLAIAMGQAPAFRADRVLPSGGDRPVPLSPGMLISIYGEHLGPSPACIANADTHRTETPNPARPLQNFAERLIYPQELCGVQVSLAGFPAGLLYVSAKQINFKVPQETPVDGEAELKVVYQGLSGAQNLRVGLESTLLTVEGEARVGAPLWIHVEMPFGWGAMVQYPVRIPPANFGCSEFEVRRNGAMLPRIPWRPPAGGISMSGNPCGNIGVEGRTIQHTGRLPLHLQYRFTEPGIYEVRYSYRRVDYGAGGTQTIARTAWTPIRVLPRAAGRRATRPAPEDAADLLSDYLPNMLGFSDAAGLDAVVACLYHANQAVRQIASMALGFWPKDEVDARMDRELAVRGPNEATIDGTLARHPEMLPLVLPYLKSDNQALLRAAIFGVSRSHPNAAAQTALMESALIAAAEHVIRAADSQTVIYYAAALGTLRDPRAGTLLWDLVRRNVARGQAVTAISWRKDPRDLPPLAALLESTDLSGLAYALRNSYGDLAIPYLESALKKSEHAWVRTACARELILAGRPSGLAFVAQAIEEKKLYAREMIQFVQERFPQLRGATDEAVLTFLRAR